MCQRCGVPVRASGSHNILFSPVVNDEQAEALPEAYEPIEVDEFGAVDLLAMIDEIILSLPVVPVHESEHCEASEADTVFGQLPPRRKETESVCRISQFKA